MATEAEIEKKYRKLIEEADDADKMRLEAEKNKEIADLFRTAARTSQQEAMKREAVNKYPLAVLTEVEGETPEELEESAKASHERIQAKVAEHSAEIEKQLAEVKQQLEEAKAAGWKGNTAGGGGAPNQTEEEEKYAFIDKAWKGLREGTITRPEAERMMSVREGDVVWKAMAKLMGAET